MNGKVWYLGLDFGTTGLSAVLWDQAQIYPLSWISLAKQEGNFLPNRLPTTAYWGLNMGVPTSSARSPFVVGAEAIAIPPSGNGIYLENFKPFLNLTIPYYIPEQHQWEPKLQLRGQKSVSLYLVQRALQALLLTLHPDSVQAVGLSTEALQTAFSSIEGVIVSCPLAWGDAYRFNVREALLSTKIISRPQRIFFLEEAIASVLGFYSHPNPSLFQEKTLVIHCGATTTELALVDLPESRENLDYTDFKLSSLAYGSLGLNQDIFWQLLYPQWLTHHPPLASLKTNLPLPGADSLHRDSAYQRLQQHLIGQSALKAANLVQQILQHRPAFTSKLGNASWTVQRQDLDKKVLQPYIRQINSQVNTLLSRTGLSASMITQVILSGGTIPLLLPVLQTWLSQKFVNATLIQPENTAIHIAAGLSLLPRFAKVLQPSRHQYSDYFLLSELLAFLNEDTISVEKVMQHLQKRGINTRTCAERILASLEGPLPPGLIPAENHQVWLTESSQNHSTYSAIAANRLLSEEGTRGYRLNLQQRDRLRQYLQAIVSGTEQKFAEPLEIDFPLG